MSNNVGDTPSFTPEPIDIPPDGVPIPAEGSKTVSPITLSSVHRTEHSVAADVDAATVAPDCFNQLEQQAIAEHALNYNGVSFGGLELLDEEIQDSVPLEEGEPPDSGDSAEKLPESTQAATSAPVSTPAVEKKQPYTPTFKPSTDYSTQATRTQQASKFARAKSSIKHIANKVSEAFDRMMFSSDLEFRKEDIQKRPKNFGDPTQESIDAKKTELQGLKTDLQKAKAEKKDRSQLFSDYKKLRKEIRNDELTFQAKKPSTESPPAPVPSAPVKAKVVQQNPTAAELYSAYSTKKSDPAVRSQINYLKGTLAYKMYITSIAGPALIQLVEEKRKEELSIFSQREPSSLSNEERTRWNALLFNDLDLDEDIERYAQNKWKVG